MNSTTTASTRTIEFWVIEWDGMERNKDLQPAISFDEPWEDGYSQYRCSKYTAEVPDNFDIINREDGVLWLFDMNNSKYPAFTEVDHDISTLTIDVPTDDGWGDGKHAIHCPIKPVKAK